MILNYCNSIVGSFSEWASSTFPLISTLAYVGWTSMSMSDVSKCLWGERRRMSRQTESMQIVYKQKRKILCVCLTCGTVAIKCLRYPYVSVNEAGEVSHLTCKQPGLRQSCCYLHLQWEKTAACEWTQTERTGLNMCASGEFELPFISAVLIVAIDRVYVEPKLRLLQKAIALVFKWNTKHWEVT